MKKTLLLLFLAASMVASAQMIGATNSQGTYRPAGDNYNLRPTGSLLRFGVGTPYASLAFDYQLTPWLMVGVGAGYGDVRMVREHFYYNKPANSYEWYLYRTDFTEKFDFVRCIPMYVEAELRTPRYKWSVFLNVKMGYCLPLSENIYRDGRNQYYAYGEEGYALEERMEAKRFLFAALAGVGYKNVSLGFGYSNCVDGGITLNISYNLPIATLRRWLLF